MSPRIDTGTLDGLVQDQGLECSRPNKPRPANGSELNEKCARPRTRRSTERTKQEHEDMDRQVFDCLDDPPETVDLADLLHLIVMRDPYLDFKKCGTRSKAERLIEANPELGRLLTNALREGTFRDVRDLDMLHPPVVDIDMDSLLKSTGLTQRSRSDLEDDVNQQIYRCLRGNRDVHGAQDILGLIIYHDHKRYADPLELKALLEKN
ncbi:hypothetical protein SCP_0800200 [Sparassis crispa]|uniref:Uncharacterized protein n=1 Tax=Sparassis crispa TaxID=139825 RepID=A0A401GTJ8_9APHY|nr:hypothetical protein SCP_0800200 [Sparassis crispa]GBE85503.1 hypothetical protein SCP_0800200 [Sparassis crispa]